MTLILYKYNLNAIRMDQITYTGYFNLHKRALDEPFCNIFTQFELKYIKFWQARQKLTIMIVI